VRDEMRDALVAELQTIESWDTREKSAHEDEIEARRRRRLEIIREIERSDEQVRQVTPPD
jgi:hypothetical protein